MGEDQSSAHSGEAEAKERGAGVEHSRAPSRALAAADAPRIGLALSSGGARGFAHVGVIKALLAAGYTIVDVAGSSIGSIVAAGYALHGDARALEEWVLDFRARDYARRGLPFMDPARLLRFLNEKFEGASFDDCTVPLRIVATDLRARAALTIEEGSIALAAFASSTLPFVHRPVAWEGQLLADGSLSCVLPLAQANIAGVDLVVGSLVSRRLPVLNGFATGLARTAGGAIRGWGRPYIDYFRERTSYLPWAAPAVVGTTPTIVLSPQLARIGPLDFGRMRDAIAAGELAVNARLDEIHALLSTASPR